jgi:hypothetical protein
MVKLGEGMSVEIIRFHEFENSTSASATNILHKKTKVVLVECL